MLCPVQLGRTIIWSPSRGQPPRGSWPRHKLGTFTSALTLWKEYMDTQMIAAHFSSLTPPE